MASDWMTVEDTEEVLILEPAQLDEAMAHGAALERERLLGVINSVRSRWSMALSLLDALEQAVRG